LATVGRRPQLVVGVLGEQQPSLQRAGHDDPSTQDRGQGITEPVGLAGRGRLDGGPAGFDVAAQATHDLGDPVLDVGLDEHPCPLSRHLR
jgi:hypothetical protein